MTTAPNSIIHTCPDCKRVLYFLSAETNMIVCSGCGSVVYRDKNNELYVQPVRVAEKKASLVQPGTTGIWNGKTFTVSGRFRAWFDEAVISYWTLIMNDGSVNWLEDGYGMYAIYEPVATPTGVTESQLKNILLGNRTELFPGKKYVLEKKPVCLRWEIEGEIYIPETKDAIQLYEFVLPQKSYYTIFSYLESKTFSFKVNPVSFELLQLKNLRGFTYSEKKFTCKNCREDIVVKTFPMAQSCACKKCGTFYELHNGTDFKPEKGGTGNENYIYISLGKKGILDGHEYEMIGFVCKEEMNEYKAQWREYTLFNPEAGYAFLSEFDGHWIFLKERAEAPALVLSTDRSFNYKNEPFRLFNEYSSKVITAVGEFPNNIFNNSGTHTHEFISPPEIWIQERNSREGIIWYHGKHISRNAIQKAFNLNDMPTRFGVGAVQPKGYMNLPKIAMATLAGLLFIMLLFTGLRATHQDRELLNQFYSFADTADKISVVTEKFDLDKRRGNMLLEINAPVSNSWFELGATLVNAKTGEEYNLEQGVEYYYGYTDGENWKEGSNHENAWFKKIPAGTYFLQLEGIREPNRGITGFQLTVRYDVASWRNMWWALIIVAIFGVVKYILVNLTERSRWSNSPVAAAEKEGEE